MRAGLLFCATALAACAPTRNVAVERSKPAAQVSDHFVSFGLDLAQLVGQEPIDLTRPRLARLLEPFRGAWLRVGGIMSDDVAYLTDTEATELDLASASLHAEQWDSLMAFARGLGARVAFTLNAGRAARIQFGGWQSRFYGRWNEYFADDLLQYAWQTNAPVDVWELGNEVNMHGARSLDSLYEGPTPRQYGEDLVAARRLLDQRVPGARLAAPATLYRPGIGEPVQFLPLALDVGGDAVGVVTWHYHPAESTSCKSVSVAPTANDLLAPARLDELDRFATEVETIARANTQAAEVWLGATNSADCGGQPGLSDRFPASLWWLDALGTIARHGETVIVRQPLTGGPDALLAEPTLDPRPDYLMTLLWQRMMGPRALAVRSTGPATLRVHAQCAAGGPPGAVMLVAINVDATALAWLTPDLDPPARVWRIQDVRDGAASINGVSYALDANDVFPDVAYQVELAPLAVGPRSAAFVLFPNADAPACR